MGQPLLHQPKVDAPTPPVPLSSAHFLVNFGPGFTFLLTFMFCATVDKGRDSSASRANPRRAFMAGDISNNANRPCPQGIGSCAGTAEKK